MNMKWSELAKSRMKDLAINQDKLAEHLGITKGAVNHWLNARREPSLVDIAKIFRFLGMKAFTVSDNGTIFSSIDVPDIVADRVSVSPSTYPVLTLAQIGTGFTTADPTVPQDIIQWISSDASVQGNAFWLQVTDDSMTAPAGISIPEGTWVLFDTGREATNGNLVMAKLTDANEATFKKLVIDLGKRYLKELNPAWPMLPVDDNCQIIGVGVETKMRLI